MEIRTRMYDIAHAEDEVSILEDDIKNCSEKEHKTEAKWLARIDKIEKELEDIKNKIAKLEAKNATTDDADEKDINNYLIHKLEEEIEHFNKSITIEYK